MIDMVTSNATGVFVKKATPDDIPAILDVAKATWEPYVPRNPVEDADRLHVRRDLHAGLPRKPDARTGTHVPDSLQGRTAHRLRFVRRQAGGDNKIYKLHKLYIRPDVQGSGYGRTLLTAVEKEVRQLGATALELNVNRYNPAIRFYERCGYSQYKEEDLPIGEFWMNDFGMRKELR
jgi:GNAT superfamily N-acetyltransferase